MDLPKKKVTLMLGCTYAETAAALLPLDEDEIADVRISVLQKMDDLKEYVHDLIAKGDECVKMCQQLTDLLDHIDVYANSMKGGTVQ